MTKAAIASTIKDVHHALACTALDHECHPPLTRRTDPRNLGAIGGDRSRHSRDAVFRRTDDYTQVLHGGVIATLIDTAGAAALASGISPDDNASGGATANLTVNYLGAAKTDLTATGKVVHRTRSATLTEVHVTDAQGTLVATGQVNSRVFRDRSAASR